ncbi:transposase [Mycobacterium sp. pW049]|uniref:transposase n=1 Tax=[Mycobacterium] bulgaricum TaxID=3238985 RepID=UPI00351BA11D
MVNVLALIEVGVNVEGYREILGFDVTTAEDGAGWLTFWRALTARGLGVKLITSDAHTGLAAAIGAHPAQRDVAALQNAFHENLLAITPKSSWPWVRTLLHSVFDQPDTESVAAQYDRIIEPWPTSCPRWPTHLRSRPVGSAGVHRVPHVDLALSGRTTRRSGSTRTSVGAPMSSRYLPPIATP